MCVRVHEHARHRCVGEWRSMLGTTLFVSGSCMPVSASSGLGLQMVHHHAQLFGGRGVSWGPRFRFLCLCGKHYANWSISLSASKEEMLWSGNVPALGQSSTVGRKELVLVSTWVNPIKTSSIYFSFRNKQTNEFQGYRNQGECLGWVGEGPGL